MHRTHRTCDSHAVARNQRHGRTRRRDAVIDVIANVAFARTRRSGVAYRPGPAPGSRRHPPHRAPYAVVLPCRGTPDL